MMVGDIDGGMLHAQLHGIAQHIQLNEQPLLAHGLRVLLCKGGHVSGVGYINRIADGLVGIPDLKGHHKPGIQSGI